MGNVSDFLRAAAANDVVRPFAGVHAAVKAGDLVAASRLTGTIVPVPPIDGIGDNPTGAKVPLAGASALGAGTLNYYGRLASGGRVFAPGLGTADTLFVVNDDGSLAGTARNIGQGNGHLIVDGDEIVSITYNNATSCRIRVWGPAAEPLRDTTLTTGAASSPAASEASTQIIACADVYVLIWYNSATPGLQWCSIDKAALTLVQAPTTLISGSASSILWTVAVGVDAGWLLALSYNMSSQSHVAAVFVNHASGTPYASASATGSSFSGQVGITDGPPAQGTAKRPLIRRNGTSVLFPGYTGSSTTIAQIVVAGAAAAPILTMSIAGHNSSGVLFHGDMTHVYAVVALSGSIYVYGFARATTAAPTQSSLGTSTYTPTPSLGAAIGSDVLVVEARTDAAVAKSFRFTCANGVATLSGPVLTGNVARPRALAVLGRTVFVVCGRGWTGSAIEPLRYIPISLDAVSEGAPVELIGTGGGSELQFPTTANGWEGSPLVIASPLVLSALVSKYPSADVTTPIRWRPGAMAALGVAKTDAAAGVADVQLAGWADLGVRYEGFFGLLDHATAGGNKVAVFGRNARIGEV